MLNLLCLILCEVIRNIPEVKKTRKGTSLYYQFYVLHFVCSLIVCCGAYLPDLNTIRAEEQLPSDYFPQHSLLRCITSLNYFIGLFSKYCAIPCYFAWYFLAPIFTNSYLRWFILSFFRTPKPFNCDDFEESAEDIVRNVKLHRKYALGRFDYERNVKIILSKNIYYKRIDQSELSKTEIEFWPDLNHESILSLYKFHATSLDPFFVVQERAWRNGLNDILYNDGFNDRDDFFHFAIKWAQDILMGLQYLHSKNLYHLDLEPESIMLEFGGRYDASNCKAVIANFRNMTKLKDNSKEVEEDAVGFCEYYRPPECFMKSKVDAEKCDMWGLGIIILEIFSGGLLALWLDQYPEFNHRRRDNHLNKLLAMSNFSAAIGSAHRCFRSLQSVSEDDELANISTHEFTTWDMELFWQTWVFVTDLLKLDSYTRINLENSLKHGFIKNVCNAILNPGVKCTQTGDYKKKVEAFAENVENSVDDEA